MVEVVDAGIGLSEEAMKTVFNPFQQTQRLAGGTGLGLYSLAKKIEALRGTYSTSAKRWEAMISVLVYITIQT